MARIDMDWDLKKLGNFFKFKCYPQKSRKDIIVSAPWLSLFDIFFITLEEHFVR